MLRNISATILNFTDLLIMAARKLHALWKYDQPSLLIREARIKEINGINILKLKK